MLILFYFTLAFLYSLLCFSENKAKKRLPDGEPLSRVRALLGKRRSLRAIAGCGSTAWLPGHRAGTLALALSGLDDILQLLLGSGGVLIQSGHILLKGDDPLLEQILQGLSLIHIFSLQIAMKCIA